MDVPATYSDIMSDTGLTKESAPHPLLVRFFKLDEFEPERAVTSHWVSPKALAIVRGFLLFYAAYALVFNIVLTSTKGGMATFFCFFTNLTYIGLTSYLAVSFYHSIRYIRTPSPHKPTSFTNQHKLLTYAYWFLYDTVVTFNIIVPVVFWALLSQPLIEGNAGALDWYNNADVHALSFVMMMTDVTLNRMRLIAKHSIIVFIVMTLYLLETFITYATQHFWVYPFLNWSQGVWAFVWIIIVAVVLTICFFLQVGFHRLRDFTARRIMGTEAGKSARQTELEIKV